MNKEVFEYKVKEYLENNNWIAGNNKQTIYVHPSECTYDYSNHIKNGRYYDINKIADQIIKVFKKQHLQESHYVNVVNPFPDSDFIVAALQYINHFIYGDVVPKKDLIYSFQPVIREIPSGETSKNGFLRSFINVGTIGIMQNINDYFEQLELWFDVLSACHIHISRIGIRIKSKTRAYNGYGVELTVDGCELGQANYYEIDYQGKFIGITDIGYGLERICWAANNWKHFPACFQCAEAYFLGLDDASDLINLIVLLIASGVKPGANGVSAYLRKQIREYAHIYLRADSRPLVKYAVTQLQRYLNPNLCYEEIQSIFDREMDRAICIEIATLCGVVSYDKMIKNSEIFCSRLLERNSFRPESKK